MTADSVVSRAIGAWRIAIVDAKRAAHTLARVQSQQLREKYPHGVHRAVHQRAGKIPLHWNLGDPIEKGRLVDRYDVDN